MRLSKAIILGSTTCKLEPMNINSCAYGCALNAMGVPQLDGRVELTPDRNSLVLMVVGAQKRYLAIGQLWPWTTEGENLTPLAESIYLRFDGRVCNGVMTLNQLADYVRSIEPNCDCNRFNCNCAQAAVQAAEVTHAQR